jgi:hypothetical protein
MYLYIVKKVMTAILALCYLVFTSGFTLNVHYCMGKIDSIQIGASHAKVCGKCGMHTEDSKGCCKDETTIYKIEDNHNIAQVSYNYVKPFSALAITFSEFQFTSVSSLKEVIPQFADTSPPPLLRDRCILFSTFRI